MSRRRTLMRIRGLVPVLALPALLALGWVYQVDPSICNGCGLCIPHCPTGALSMEGPNAVIDPDLCDACGECVPYCIRGAIFRCWWEDVAEGGIAGGGIAIAPNPTPGPIRLTGASPGAPVVVASLSGRLVRTSRTDALGETMIDLAGLPPGLYLCLQDGEPLGSVLLLGRST